MLSLKKTLSFREFLSRIAAFLILVAKMRNYRPVLVLAPLVLLSGCQDPAPDGSTVIRPSRTGASPRSVTGDQNWDAGVRTDFVDRVLLVSVDGLGAVYLGGPLHHGRYQTLQKLRDQGSSTLNARTDCDYTVTLPNHTSMLTGRPVAPDPNLPSNAYHGWTSDGYSTSDETLHNSGNPNVTYISSVFDVAHDNGLRTCMYAGKSKFSLYSTSYDATNGAIDHVGADNGRNKIDHVVIIDYDSDTLIAQATADFDHEICDFAFVHIAETDLVGHDSGWGTPEWLVEVDRVDDWLRQLAEHTIFADNHSWGAIVTADHGGDLNSHGDNSDPWDYTIPFIAIGPNLTPGSDLYELAQASRRDPGQRQLRYSEPWQPIRNGEAANVALGMLGLPPIAGSFMRGLVVPQ